MEVRLVEHGSDDYVRTVDLRYEILRRPLGLTFDPDQLAAEDRELHLAIFDGDEVAACLVLTPLEAGDIKMRQVAVASNRQGTGLGRQLVDQSESVAKERGFRRMVLNARESAVPFYLRLGYAIEGEPFEEVTIPHRHMVKDLT